MFDFAWSEIMLIGAVALIAIGPKDMPAAIRTVSSMIKKARRMAAEFQTHVDEMVREAELGDVKKAFNDIRNLDLPSLVEKHIDPDRSIRSTFEENLLEPASPATEAIAADAEADGGAELEAAAEPEPIPADPSIPAFIPPNFVPPPAVRAGPAPEAPAFIPPEVAQRRQS